MILTFPLKNHMFLGYELSYDKVFVFLVAPHWDCLTLRLVESDQICQNTKSLLECADQGAQNFFLLQSSANFLEGTHQRQIDNSVSGWCLLLPPGLGTLQVLGPHNPDSMHIGHKCHITLRRILSQKGIIELQTDSHGTKNVKYPPNKYFLVSVLMVVLARNRDSVRQPVLSAGQNHFGFRRHVNLV